MTDNPSPRPGPLKQKTRSNCGAGHGSQRRLVDVLQWANCLRDVLRDRGITCVRTRVDRNDPCPVGRQDDIARAYGCDVMLSLHCNFSDSPLVRGTEVFYRGEDDRVFATALSSVVAKSLSTRDRGPKREKDSQHRSLAVLDFDKCWLIELGFLSNLDDRIAMQDAAIRLRTCIAIANLLQLHFK